MKSQSIICGGNASEGYNRWCNRIKDVSIWKARTIPVCRIEKIGIDRTEGEECFLSKGQEDGD